MNRGVVKRMLKIKKKDIVVVLSGKHKGKKGEVLRVFPGENRIVVEKINFVKKHVKSTKKEVGGIREIEAPICISKVMLICPKCNQASRPKFDKLSDGKKVRVCRRCEEMII
ncbi:MAG: 50S ribosomal protein L24 [Endomicrobium sp.]|jgi:large subunit ribosomal protein L24|nr:50S ribosomal protein L24 [Endomicrobium sp.]